MQPRLTTKLDEWDKQIRNGEGARVREGLAQLPLAKVPRLDAKRVASLAWRVNAPLIGLRILHPIVRPKYRKVSDASAEEMVEYAGCLVKVGAADEAIALLDKVNAEEEPRSLLFKSYALISQWNSEAVIPLLSKYIETPMISDYQRLVGSVNLAAALLNERQFQKADVLLSTIVKRAREGMHDLLLGNSLELSTASFTLQERLEEADNVIKEAKRLLKDTGALDEFFLRKWEAISGFVRQPHTVTALEKLRSIRSEAVKRGHWETVRDCDRHEATRTKNKELLFHVYFGTPYESFRRRLLTEFGEIVALPKIYSWALGGSDAEEEVQALLPGKGKARLRTGHLMQKLLTALAADFYRPIRIAPLHFIIYPGEFYNPTTSPARIHAANNRLRAWLKKYRVPLEVNEEHGQYSLSAKRPCKLLIPQTRATEGKVALLLDQMREGWPKEAFSAKDAAARLRISSRSALRFLKAGVDSGVLDRVGDKSSIKYKFK